MRNLLLCFILAGCGSSNLPLYKKADIRHRILKIDEYQYAYNLTTYNLSTLDTNYVLSYKRTYYDKYKIKYLFDSIKSVSHIKENDTINFNTFNDGVRINQQTSINDAFIIVEKDTIWRGTQDIISKEIFKISRNSMDLDVAPWKNK